MTNREMHYELMMENDEGGATVGKIIVREYTDGDLPECVDLYMKTFSREPWNESWESKEVVANFIGRHRANNYFLGFVAEKDGRVVAASLGFQKPWIKGMEYYIDEYFVDPDLQGQGIGSTLMGQIKERLAQKGISAVMLCTERDVPARVFYERMGFSIAERMVLLFASTMR